MRITKIGAMDLYIAVEEYINYLVKKLKDCRVINQDLQRSKVKSYLSSWEQDSFNSYKRLIKLKNQLEKIWSK